MSITQNNHPEANIKITRENGKLISISVTMPFWLEDIAHDVPEVTIPIFEVTIPGLNAITFAGSIAEAEVEVGRILKDFCVHAEKSGQGLEKELEAIGWTRAEHSEEPALGYNFDKVDEMLEQILKNGEHYVNPHLEVTPT